MSEYQNSGFAKPENTSPGAGQLKFIVESIISRLQTVTLVRVVKATGGGLAPVGFVDVQPLVAQLDGAGNAIPHGIIHNVPYMRLQGGQNAIVIDPAVGDIGMCGFCSRDISNVKKNKAPAAPKSMRRFDYSDALYFGGFLNGTPEQYIMFSDRGIKVYSPKQIELEAPRTVIKSPDVQIDGANMTVKANTVQNGSFSQTGGGSASFSGNVSAKGNIDLSGQLETGGDAVIGGKSFLRHTNKGLSLD